MLGVVQGIGEFLPISSSANLAVVSKIFKFATCSFETKVALHAGSLLDKRYGEYSLGYLQTK